MGQVVVILGHELKLWWVVAAAMMARHCLSTFWDLYWTWPHPSNHTYNVRIAKDATGEKIVVTCDNTCHNDGSRTELVARYLISEGKLEREMEYRWL